MGLLPTAFLTIHGPSRIDGSSLNRKLRRSSPGKRPPPPASPNPSSSKTPASASSALLSGPRSTNRRKSSRNLFRIRKIQRVATFPFNSNILTHPRPQQSVLKGHEPTSTGGHHCFIVFIQRTIGIHKEGALGSFSKMGPRSARHDTPTHIFGGTLY